MVNMFYISKEIRATITSYAIDFAGPMKYLNSYSLVTETCSWGINSNDRDI